MPWINKPNTWLSQEESLQNAQMVVNHLHGVLGWSKHAVSAICGNMRHESSINPDLHEFGYDDSPTRGYGLVQWTPKTKLTEWASSVGQNHKLGETQLNRIQYESDNNIQYYSTSSYPESFAEFQKSTKSLSYLTNAFCWNYERPLQSAGEASMPARIAFAQLVFDTCDFENGGGDTGGDGGVVPPPNGSGEVCNPNEQTTNNQKENEMSYYTVKPGDTLSAIAERNGVSQSVIQTVVYKAIANKDMLMVGETLYIPKQQTYNYYTVQPGDNLSTISIHLRVSVDYLIQLNNIANPNLIQAGQKLKY